MTTGPGDAATLPCQREKFLLEGDVHYLNCAYLSPRLRSVEEAGIEGLRRRRRPHLLTPEHFFTETDEVRTAFGALVNGPASRVAIIPSVSYGIATVIANLDARPGQNVVLAASQFPSNVYGWRRLCEAAGLELRTISPGEGSERRAERWNARIMEAIDGDTAAVSLGNVHWTDGTLFRLEEIAERVHAAGGLLVVDGTQSVGALPFDIERIRPDALLCAGYKWLLGPYSLGLAYLGERFTDGRPLEETWLGREGSDDFAALTDYQEAYLAGAARYDMGERSSFVLMPMLLAALRQLLEWRPDRIQRYCAELMAEPLARIAEAGYAVERPASRSAHLVGIRLPHGADPDALREALAARDISVSIRGGAVRVSPHLHNTPEDAEALVEALLAAV